MNSASKFLGKSVFKSLIVSEETLMVLCMSKRVRPETWFVPSLTVSPSLTV